MTHKRYADIAINAIGKIIGEFSNEGGARYKKVADDLEKCKDFLEAVRRMPEP